MENVKKYSTVGRLFRGFLCLLFFAGFVTCLCLCLYGFHMFGTSVLDGNKKEYLETDEFQEALTNAMELLSSDLMFASENEGITDELVLVDASRGTRNVYDVDEMYKDRWDGFSYCANLDNVSTYCKESESYAGCDLSDYECARALVKRYELSNAYLYLDGECFRGLFLKNGLQNTDYRFSDDFSKEAYFLFDFKGTSRKTIKTLEEIRQLYEVDDATNSFNLSDITYAVYDPEQNIYYSTMDNYFEQYESYVYRVSEVRDFLDESGKDHTRYNCVLLPLLQCVNQSESWMSDTYYRYSAVMQARHSLNSNYDVNRVGEIYYFSCGDTVETNYPNGADTDIENMEVWMSENDYLYCIVSVDPDDSVSQATNGPMVINDDVVSSNLKKFNTQGKPTLLYGFYHGADELPDSKWQETIEEYNFLAKWIYYIIIVGVICFVLTVIMAVWLIVITGRRFRGDSAVMLNFYDRLPFEIWILISGIILCGSVCVPYYGFEQLGVPDIGMMVIGMIVPFALVYALFVMWISLSLARRVKGHNIWNHTLLYWLIHRISEACEKLPEEKASSEKKGFFGRILSALKRGFIKCVLVAKEVYHNLKGTNRLIFFFVVFAILNVGTMGIVYNYSDIGLEWVVISALLQCVGLLGIFLLVRDTNRLIDGVSEIVKGNLDYKIETTSRWGVYNELTNNINHIGDGLKKAIETSLKDERMKTELITNVSHDLKTPLTSIINYINLLKTEKMPTPEAEHYVEVLDNKAQRLRQLTEDLVEAAKATSGNVELEMMPITFDELMRQAVGEFEDKFAAKQLSLVTSFPEGRVSILADGRRLYRVLENLLQNVCKYAMPNTRVYADLVHVEDTVMFTMKNVSEAPLNISAEELMERFTRGDSSRTTEGSGLGLSIAKDLTHLQGGTFDIILDGDLFKVVITFPELIEPLGTGNTGLNAGK